MSSATSCARRIAAVVAWFPTRTHRSSPLETGWVIVTAVDLRPVELYVADTSANPTTVSVGFPARETAPLAIATSPQVIVFMAVVTRARTVAEARRSRGALPT